MGEPDDDTARREGVTVDLRLLELFLTVAETGSVTRAAERLFLTQQAVSAGLVRLERELGGGSLAARRRGHRGVELTPAGERLLPLAGRLLADAAALRAVPDEPPTPARGRCVIGLVDEGPADLLGPIITAFVARHPGVRVEIRRAPWGPVGVRMLAVGDFDVLFGPDLSFPSADASAGRYPPDDDESSWPVEALPLFVEGRIALLPARHPLADSEVVRASDLHDEPWVVPVDIPDPAVRHFTNADLRNGETARTGREVGGDRLEDMVDAVRHGLGVLTVTPATERFFDMSGLTIRPVVGVPATTSTALTTAEARPGSSSYGADLRAISREVASTLVSLVPGAHRAASSE
jgi:DNA-binding transcriptional LysR family regulator